MKADIYDSMATAVDGAAVVITFMSQRYQDSINCKLELKVRSPPLLLRGLILTFSSLCSLRSRIRCQLCLL